MILSSILYALYEALFKYVALENNFWISNFWQFIGLLLFGITLLVFSKKYREQLLSMLRNNGKKIIGLNIINELLYMAGNIILLFAYLLAPLALVGLVNVYQPIFVFIIGILLTIFLPKIAIEKIEKRYLTQKILAISIIFIGSILLYV